MRSGATFDVSEVSFQLQAGQTLTGDGEVVGEVRVAAGGAVAPGAGVGELVVDGSLELDQDAELLLEIGAEQADKLSIGDTLDVDQARLVVTLVGDAQPGLGDSYHMLSFASAAGAWDGVQLPALSPGLGWNVSELLTTGVLAVESVLPGDYNGDGLVDAADYTVYRNSLGQSGDGLAADGDGSGAVDAADLEVWRQNYGAAIGSPLESIPEPRGLLLALAASLGGLQGVAARRVR